MNYWLNLFSGETWDDFRRAGANVTGFREGKRTVAAKVQPGDILLCYLTGVMRWVGALEMVAHSKDARPIWQDSFPVRLDTKPLILLDAENGIPMKALEGLMAFYQGEQDAGKFKGFLRGSPMRFTREEDGALLFEMLREAEQNPVPRPVDKRKMYRVERKIGREVVQEFVSVPEPEESESVELAPLRCCSSER